jgi:hypothetical protein
VKGEGGLSPTTGQPLKGTQRRISIGAHPVIGVKKARETAIDILQKAFERIDGRAARNEALATQSANTVEGVARRFIDQDAKPNIESWRQVERWP